MGVLLLKVSSLSDEDKVRLDNELQSFSKELPRPPLTVEAITLIKKDGVLLDSVAYGRRTFQTTCDIFLEFAPRWSIFKDYVLRDWDSADSTDHSLNFCGDPNLSPFQVAAFKSGKATPSSENDCSGVQFLLDILIALSADTAAAKEQAAYSVPPELRAKFQRVYIGEDIQDQGNAHLLRDSGERPFACKLCGQSFRRQAHLETHHRCMHTAEKPFECQVCNKRFNQSSHLIIHERMHTGEKPYKCGLCNYQATQTSDLSRHQRKVHHHMI